MSSKSETQHTSQRFSGEVSEIDIKRVADFFISRHSLEVDELDPSTLQLPKITVRTMHVFKQPEQTHLLPKADYRKEIYFLGFLSIQSVVGFKHIVEDNAHFNNNLLWTYSNRTWIKAVGTLDIPDASVHLEDLSFAIAPNRGSSTNHVIRSRIEY